MVEFAFIIPGGIVLRVIIQAFDILNNEIKLLRFFNGFLGADFVSFADCIRAG